MLRLHPIPEIERACPACNTRLTPKSWLIQGMRNLAELDCTKCGASFFGDLDSGFGSIYPKLLDRASGRVCGVSNDAKWFGYLLSRSYGKRISKPLEIRTIRHREPRRPLLLNCLDLMYGHSLVKLLAAQRHLDEHPDFDLVLLIPECLEWMVPDGVAEVWSVRQSFRDGWDWNDWLAEEIRGRLDGFAECHLSRARVPRSTVASHIERFTRVAPFDLQRWNDQIDSPTLTFIWRDDRQWSNRPTGPYSTLLKNRFPRLLRPRQSQIEKQTRLVAQLAHLTRRRIPRVNFHVVGLGNPGGLPSWVNDHRLKRLDAEDEREWCRIYAASHVVVGVHGSNMLLPSAHAGAVIDLMPRGKWKNIGQDLLRRESNPRLAPVRSMCLPAETTPRTLVAVTETVLVTVGQLVRASLGTE